MKLYYDRQNFILNNYLLILMQNLEFNYDFYLKIGNTLKGGLSPNWTPIYAMYFQVELKARLHKLDST